MVRGSITRSGEQCLAHIEEDWRWRDADLRRLASIRAGRQSDALDRAWIMFAYSHWEGHFRKCAEVLLGYICDGIRAKRFDGAALTDEVARRLSFAVFKQKHGGGFSIDQFGDFLQDIQRPRFHEYGRIAECVIVVEGNLNTERAVTICRNLGLDYSWFALRRIIIDERVLAARNAIAHGSQRTGAGASVYPVDQDLVEAADEIRDMTRQAKNRFSNAVVTHEFLR